MVTIQRLAEEIQLILSGGRIGVATKFSPEEIRVSITQVANQMLKMEFFQTDLPIGQIIPSGASIGTYPDNKVVKYGNISKTTLPCMPIKMPRNMGVYQVIDSNGNELVPMELGQAALIANNPILSDLAGRVGYECAGLDVLFSKDISQTNQDVFVTFRLVVLDFSKYGEYDPLPLTPEQEFTIKSEVVKMYSSEPVADKLAESTNKENRGVPVKAQEQS